MRIGVPREIKDGEFRVALTPDGVAQLANVVVEPGAGLGVGFGDEEYARAGATIGDPWQCELVVKVAPDLDATQIQAIADAVRRHRIDGVIATNTSVSRDGVEGSRHATETGGLSGAPIRDRATRVLLAFAERLKNEVCLIGAGGVMSGRDAADKFAAGASLVQLYTGLIYRGPALISECASAYRGK